jgi:hypothetical protein
VKKALFAVLYGIILAASAAAEAVLMYGLWRPFDIATYYTLAASASASIDAVLGASAASPLLLLAVPGRTVPVCILIWAAAVLVMAIGARSYSANAGILAGLVFTLVVAGAQGHMAVGDALALALALASVYCLLYLDGGYIAAGAIAGAAICLKPLTLVLPLLSLYYIYRHGSRRDAIVYAGFAAIPVIIIALAAFAVYGSNTVTMALDSGFEGVGFIAGGECRPADPLMAVAGIALSACMLASLLPLAFLGFSIKHDAAGKFFLAAGLCFIATLLIGQFLSYWAFALPFLALLCSSFGRRDHA